MADFPTYEDLVRAARDEILSRNRRLTLEVVERDGTEANVLVNAAAAVGDEVVGQVVRVAASSFLDSAQGNALDRLVFDRYGLTRKPASQALGTVELSTTAPAPVTFAIPRGTKFSTTDGREFIAWADASFSSGSTGPVAVEVRSVLSGRDQQAAKNTITALLSQLTGQPTDLKVTNSLATVGADDEETDDSLRDRARRFFTTARRGTLKAIEAAALSVPGVQKAAAFESVDAQGRTGRTVTLIISDAFTEALVEQGISSSLYNTQSQLLANEVDLALNEWRAAGVYVQIIVATTILQPVNLALRFYAGADVDRVALSARSVVAGRINGLSPGEDLNPATIIEWLRAVNGLEVTGAEVLSPLGVVVASPYQVIRSTTNLVRAITVQPDRALANTNNPDAV